MGFLGGLANIAGLQAANVYNNPEQAAVGANTPESTYALNKTVAPTMDKHYTPTVNMMGGATQGEMQQNAAQGYDNTGAQAANAAGAAAAMYFTGGAATPLVMGQAAADQYARAHPHSNFNQEYNGIIASNPNINAGLSTSGYGSGYSYAKGGDVEQPSGLHDIAKHVQSQGRGEDTVLVHMTPNEVGGLQALAKAKGGTLTRNPQTGLYEAGFLSSMLPMIAGAALTVMSDGALAPWAAGLMVGAGDYAMTGSLQQGLMAGLGAWSGGSLGEGLASAGASDLAGQAGTEAAKTGFEGGAQQATLGSVEEALPAAAATPAPTSAANAADMLNKGTITPDQYSKWAGDFSQGYANAPAASMAKNFGTGISSLSDIGTAVKANPMAAAGAAMPLLSGALFKQNTVNPVTSVSAVNQPLARLSPDYKGTQPIPPPNPYQAKYPNYVQTPYNPATGLPAPQSPGTQYSSAVTAAEGGLMGIQKYAEGGGVSQVNPAQTDFMAGGGMYPQSQQDHTQFATPSQMPASAALMNSDFDTKTNPLTGVATGPGMAEGGVARLATGGTPLPGSGAGGDFKPTGGMISNALVGMGAAGPSHVYQPSYVNYAQTPYRPAQATTYNPANIPIPNRAPMGNTQTPGIAGYAIDPKGMIGSPAYKQLQDELAAAQAQAAQAQTQPDYGGSGGGKAGGVMPDDLAYAGGGILAFAQGSQKPIGNKDMAAIDEYTAQAQEEGGLASIKDAADKGDWNAMLALQKLGYKASGGGVSSLGAYSDGGHLLKGPGDGVSDSIPAQIGTHQPARLADGEFVVPARIVSELGNGSTDAGAKRLYAMMQRVQAKRKKSMGKGKFAVNSKAENDLPA